MKNITIITLLLLLPVFAFAQSDVQITDFEVTDSGTSTTDTDTTDGDTRDVEIIDLSSDTSDDPTSDEGTDTDEPVLMGDTPNTDTTTTDPGERVMQPEFGADAEGDTSAAQHNQSDLDFLRESAGVSASAAEVRGWDIKKKESFLSDVKEHAEVNSATDLENFAKGVLLRDNSIDAIDIKADKIKVNHRAPVKFLGLFSTTLPAETEVDKQGRVKVKFPWYGFLFSGKLSASDVEASLEDSEAASNPISKAAGVLNTLVNLL